MKFADHLKGKFFTILFNRISIFFFLLCLLSVFLYFLGTYQGFMDTTQVLLLRMTFVFGILLAVSSVFGFFVDLSFLIRKKKIRYLFSILLYFTLAGIGGSVAISAFFIIVVSAGNGV